ncbi:hypothetical protein H4R18_001478 [Coemansia javaensis]|uniref:Hikeshi-like domain-containing protein n=1 Tax=Coemansia javaensis TaxID=2761396 RepID=A0A9W8LKJ0_9FUNG|nr:hypothetical protein H4R18_001478 [Coemansia javaensis]
MFGCIVAGRLVQTNLRQVDVGKYVFELPDAQSINHIVVFLLGTAPFEPGFAATVHLLWPSREWQFLGALSNDKPSAIFRLRAAAAGAPAGAPGTSAELGISVEPIQAVEQQVQLHQQQQQQQQPAAAGAGALALVRAPSAPPLAGQPAVQAAQQLAERALQNLYDYATSFATRADASMGVLGSGAAVQVLPVKVFDDWYRAFLRRIQRDPAAALGG